jgi:hypothetical protein
MSVIACSLAQFVTCAFTRTVYVRPGCNTCGLYEFSPCCYSIVQFLVCCVVVLYIIVCLFISFFRTLVCLSFLGDWSNQNGVIRRNTIVTIKRENTIYNDLKTTLHRKQNIEQYEPYRKLTVNSGEL